MKFSACPRVCLPDMYGMLFRIADMCAFSKQELVSYSKIPYEVKLKEGATPVIQRPFKVRPEHVSFVDREIKLMENIGVIRDARSEWGFWVVVAPKDCGTDWRFCVNFKPLNK